MEPGVEELIALFTGVEHEDGGWITTPTHSISLATAIADLCDPSSEVELRRVLYGDRSRDLIDPYALYVIELCFKRYSRRDAETTAG